MIASQWSELAVHDMKGRLTAVCEVVEEERGKIEEWIEEDEMGQMGDALEEL